VFIAQFTQMSEKTRLCRIDAALALNRLHHDRAGFIRYFAGDRIEIVEITINETAGNRLEAFVIFRLRGGGNGSQGTPVETAVKRDNFALFRTFTVICGKPACEFDRRFVGFGAGVTEKRFRRKRCPGYQLRRQPDRRFVEIDITGMPEFLALGEQCIDQFRILMAQRVDADTGAEIDIFVAVQIPQARAFAVIQNDALGFVVGDKILPALFDQRLTLCR
jgi:hypothetical protein